MKKLGSNGGHRNIIIILRHGWLNKDQWYYFDMELCAMNLQDFIYGKYITALGNPYFDPISVGDEPKCLRLWNIMLDITRGLEYIHSHREVHRDLKPQNGTSIDPTIANAVLLSIEEGAWKIGDFGLTFEGTSRIQYTTRRGRGTEGFRALEVMGLKELGFVTKASDIWALGCILHELVFKEKRFSCDVQVWDYARGQKLKERPHLEGNERTAACVRELMRRALDVDWWKRPTASDVLQLLESLTEHVRFGTVFYIGETESELDSSDSSIADSLSPSLVYKGSAPSSSFVATPHFNPPRPAGPIPISISILIYSIRNPTGCTTTAGYSFSSSRSHFHLYFDPDA